MTVDRSKLQFYSGDPIDKVVATRTVTYTNDGATTQAPQTAKIQTDTIDNPYGKKCFARFKWSVDGTNFNSPTTVLSYTYTSTNPGGSTIITGQKAAVSVGVSDSTIYFVTGNGWHGDVSDDGTTYTYTPTSQTFTIKYALFEVE